MQCPSCDHQAPQAEFGEVLKCPACGAFYAKALAAKLRQAEVSAPAASVVQQARAVNEAKRQPVAISDAQPVVVVDVQMKFWSMVMFMVKWALAAIPAIIILTMIGTALVAVVGGGLLSSVSDYSATTLSADDAGAPPALSAASPELVAPPVEKPIVATLVDKGFFSTADGHLQDELAFTLIFENNTGRTITDFDGTAQFLDRLGNKVISANVVSDAYLAPGATVKRGFTLRYNQFMQDHIKFKEIEQSRLVVIFEPRRAVFKGGETKDF